MHLKSSHRPRSYLHSAFVAMRPGPSGWASLGSCTFLSDGEEEEEEPLWGRRTGLGETTRSLPPALSGRQVQQEARWALLVPSLTPGDTEA